MIIYTDGSALSPNGPGGISVVFLSQDQTECTALSAPLTRTTSPRAELTAMLIALQAIPDGARATIYCDCIYVTNGINNWLSGWRARGYRNARRKQISHIDLWQQLDHLLAERSVVVRRVRGHQGNPGNDIADQLARTAAKKGAEKWEA